MTGAYASYQHLVSGNSRLDHEKKWDKLNCQNCAFPDAQYMVYLPTKLGSFWGFSCSPIEHLGSVADSSATTRVLTSSIGFESASLSITHLGKLIK